jgi:protein gp37
MGETTSIGWTDATFNPWIGCQRVSPGCVHCYAEHTDTFVRIQRAGGRELWGPRGDRHVTSDAYWRKPLAWNRAAEQEGVRRRVFCASLADVFEDRPDLVPHRARLFVLIQNTPWLDWLLLTKRPENMVRLAPEDWADSWPLNVWAGTTVEDQQRADERVPQLLNVPAAVRFLSAEPLLESVNLNNWLSPPAFGSMGHYSFGPGQPVYRAGDTGPFSMSVTAETVDWVIVGGESGAKARPFDLAWAYRIVEYCRSANVAVFVKQLGSRPVWHSRFRTAHPKGEDWNEWPADLRVRQWPESPAALVPL